MLLYTIESYERIFEQKFPCETKTKQMGNNFVEIQKSGESFTVSRLISTDPAMYLRPEWTPGAAYPEVKG